MTRHALVLLLLVALARPAAAATASASSNSLFLGTTATTPGTATWRWLTPTSLDTITWKSGTNHADATPFTHTDVSETYFTFVLPPPPAPPNMVIGGKAAFTGFSYTDGPGAAGSVATTSGAGSSTYVARKGVANWTVTATGTLGTSAPPNPSWDSTCSGADPRAISLGELSTFTSEYNLFFVAGLTDASFSPNGSAELNVSYDTAAGSDLLLSIHLSSAGAVVTGGTAAGLTIYDAPAVDVDPDTFLGSPQTAAQIQSDLQSDLSGNALGSDHYFAFFLSGLSIPTTDMGSGVGAEVHATAKVSDAAAAPEPAASMLLGVAVAVIAIRRRLGRPRETPAH
jgi:hypothetical protein